MCYFCEPAGLELNYFNGKIVLTFVLEAQHYDNTLYTGNISTNIFFYITVPVLLLLNRLLISSGNSLLRESN